MARDKVAGYRWAIALGLFAIALVLRLYRLGQWSFWIDEILALTRAQQLVATGHVDNDWPRLSLLLNGLALHWLGESEWAARVVSAVLGAALVPTVYSTVSPLENHRTGLIAGILLAVSPWHIFLSQNARYYSAFLLFSYLTFIFVYHSVTKKRFIYYVLSIIFFLLTFLERFYWGMVLPALVAFVICYGWSWESWPTRRWQHLTMIYLATLATLIVAGVALLPLLRSYSADIDKVAGIILSKGPFMRPAWTLSKSASDLGLPVISLGLTGLIRRRSKAPDLITLAAFLAISGLTTAVAMSSFTQVYTRYIMYVLPCWVIMAAATLDEILSGKRVVLLAALCTIPLVLYDRLWYDMFFFTSIKAWLPRVITVFILLLLLVIWLIRSWPAIHVFLEEHAWSQIMPFFRQTDCLAASLAVLMCLYAIAQPLAADWFYYQQDGLRLDWQPVSSVLRERMEKYDLVLSGEWMVASYYLDYPVVNTRLVSAEVLDQVPTPIWILADYGAERDMTPDLRRWTKERCSEIFADGYMYRGQWWDLRLLECPACVDK